MARYGIIIDGNRCTGCMTCVLACKEENLTGPGVWWNKVLELESERLDRIVYFRYACMHCSNPPCVEACPEHAVYRRPDGIVLIDQGKCKGRGECIKACPYGRGKAFALMYRRVREFLRNRHFSPQEGMHG